MRFALKLMANLTDPRGGDAMDRVINALLAGWPRPHEWRPTAVLLGWQARVTTPGPIDEGE